MPELAAWIIALSPFALIGYVWICAALAALFRKAGKAQWRAWVPVLNVLALLRLGGLRGWWLMLVLVPGAGAIALCALLGVVTSRVGGVLGLPRASALLGAVLFPVWVSVAGWGHRGYTGVEHPAVRRLRASDPVVRDAQGAHARYVQRGTEPDGPWPFGETLSDVLGVKRSTGLRTAPPATPRWVPRGSVREAQSWPERGIGSPSVPENLIVPPRPPQPIQSPTPDPHPSPQTMLTALPEPELHEHELAYAPKPQSSPQPEPLPTRADPANAIAFVRPRPTRSWLLTPRNEQGIPLNGDVVILGRRPASDPVHPSAQLVALHDATRTVSKTHARLERRGDAWRVTDLGSTNGVVVIDPDGTEHDVVTGRTAPLVGSLLLGDIELRLDQRPGT